VDPAGVTAVVNTADDFVHLGLHISPDIDTLTYTLAGLVNQETGWGVAGDTTACLEALGRLGEPTWFRLGDRDLAQHLARTRLLREGVPLSGVTDRLRSRLGVAMRILPMSDDEVATEIDTPEGTLPFQEYFVRDGCRHTVLAVRFRGAARARPAPGVLDAIGSAEAILIAPSNPLVSIGPILAVPGIREALERASSAVAAVSPIVGGKALKGPADAMLRDLGHEPSALGVARLYAGIARVFVLDEADAALRGPVEALGMRAVVTDTIMSTPERARALAGSVLEALA
jgi:LPPG:FO 2-phospho-L-lactate transferase